MSRSKDRRRKIFQSLGLALGATVLVGVLWSAGVLDRWESTTWDWRVRALAGRGANAQSVADSPVCLILLDQPSLDWGQQSNGWSWPWPREVYTAIIDFCVRGGARAIAFDVLFTEPSVYGVWDDAALGEAIAASGVFVGAAFVHTESDSSGLVTRPIADVLDHCRILANVSDVPDDDGVFRRAALWRETSGAGRLHSLGAAAGLVGRDSMEVRQVLNHGPAVRILNYHDPATFWPIYSAAGVVQSDLRLAEGGQPALDPKLLQGKYVLFGMSAPGLKDLRPTPLSRVSPGVWVHATVLENLLRDDFIAEPPVVLVVGVILLFSFLGCFLLLMGGRLWRTIAILFGFLLLPALLGMAAALNDLWWPVLPGTLAQAAALAGAMILAWATEGRQKRFIRQAFRHYLSPDVIQRIMEDPDRLKLGGERRELTIFFSDLEGFTTISEGLEPHDLTQLLNEYLTDMTDIILESGGTLDKYEGDAIIAFWNAPVDQPDHALRACRASVLCQRRLAERRPEFEERFGATMRMRIGLNSGPVIVGNMGSNQRFDYTMLGDAANLAARLEGANKVFGTYLMISEETRLAASGVLLSRPLGRLRVVGRKQPVLVHELAGLKGDAEPASWPGYRQGLACCAEGRLSAAREAFATCGEDSAALKWLTRLTGEQDGFDPVWNLTRK